MSGSDEFRASFFEECEELLEAMHDGFGLMQDGSDDDETIHVIFRAVHSIKGGSGAFGLDELVAFAHHFETALDQLRAGKIEQTSDLLDLFQQCGDQLADLVSAARDETSVDDARSEVLRGRLDTVIGSGGGSAEEKVSEAAESFVPMTLDLGGFGAADPIETASSETRAGHILTFIAEPELFASGNEPALLFRALDRFGQVRISAAIDDVPPLSLLDPMMSSITWKIEIETDTAEDVIKDVFDFVSDCSDVKCAPLSQTDPECHETSLSEESEIEATEGNSSPEATAISPSTAETASSSANQAEAAPSRSEPAKIPETSKKATPQTIRVDFERVDKLINLVGELVIKEAMLSQAISALDLQNGNEFLVELDGLKQLAGEIQEGVMAIRAQPVKPLFQRMARTIRDASEMTGKRVRLVMKGEAAEVDKTVLERLVDPLTHMVRNAVDHGLEDAETRRSNGKPADGTVTLSAAHRSGRVVIEISDDGAGINRERVRKIAEEKGLVSPEANLTPAEVDALLFMPGFSSKDEVSELSGRGVGLDVAKSEILALGGRLTIQSEPGSGSVFSISLPLTLAVMEGMVVDVAGQTMVVPITAIQETLQPTASNIHTIGSGSKVLNVRDSLVPIADLGAIFGFRDPPNNLENHVLLVLETETERRCALLVDGLQDQRQVVIKSLETNYDRIDGIAAATILGDGRIALIVDPEGVASGVAPSVAFPQESFVQVDEGVEYVPV